MLIYHTITALLSLIIAPFFLLSNRGRKNIKQRFGFDLPTIQDQKEVFWFHASSLGELNGITELLKKFKLEYPENQILISCISISGVIRAQELGYKSFLLPFDSKFYYQLALNKYKLKVFIFTETEVWPALLDYLKSRTIPAFWINAKFRKKNLFFYKLLSFFFAKQLAVIRRIYLSDSRDEALFYSLNLPREQIAVLGNTKFDKELLCYTQDQLKQFHQELFCQTKPLIILSSIRPGEEQVCFQALLQLIKEGISFQCIVAPRHQEKFSYFEEALKKFSIPYAKRSDNLPAATDFLLLDTIGELNRIYALATVSFVGGTLVPVGGHSPLEALSCSVPVFFGSHTEFIEQISEEILQAKAGSRIHNSQEIAQYLLKLLRDQEYLVSSRQAAKSVILKHRGASNRILETIKRILNDI